MATKTKAEALNEHCSHVLSSVYPVVELILSYLPYRELESLSRVCQLWHGIVRKLREKRSTMSFAAFDGDDLVQGTKSFLNDMYTEPGTVFLFHCNILNELLETLILNAEDDAGADIISDEEKDKSYGEFVRSLLPCNCNLVALEAGGIVGTSSDLKEINEMEGEGAVSFLCLPKYNTQSKLEIVTISDSVDLNLVEKSYNNHQLKACLVFDVDPKFLPKRFGYTLLDEYAVLIAGAYVDNVCTMTDEFLNMELVSFYGNDVKVASVILPPPKSGCNNLKEKTEAAVVKLKKYNLPEKNSFAFMLACIGRGEGMYGERNVESSLFHKHFPNTPLVGLFGNGEIGCDFYDCASASGCDMKRRKSELPKLFHSYTTILVLVALT
ncbi:FBX22-like protein [Mya arenaria]|uniref:FBX22-like protein n=1 Tax=Mya arenaria TaxID=6604 RepID=A0ABY7DUB1_MYAAR|nr:F-box only protein 22-like [Mya arenaria]WAR00205.1 FBX22-like protein [Mya arenaria]